MKFPKLNRTTASSLSLQILVYSICMYINKVILPLLKQKCRQYIKGDTEMY